MAWKDLIHPDDLAALRQARKQAQLSGSVYECEYRERHPGGEYRWVLARAVAMRDAQGRVTKWFGTTTDIHDLKEALRQRDEALEQLRASEERFRTLVEAVPQSLWMARPDGWIEYYNHKGRWPEGGPGALDRLTGFGWQDLIHPDDRESFAERMRQAQESGHPSESEYRLRLQDGTYRWFLGRAVPVRDAGGHVVRWFGASTDVHDLKQALRQRDEALARLQALEANAALARPGEPS
jgi:PAS domain S-box-containing protein